VRAERAGGAVVGLDRSDDERPVPGTDDGPTILVAVPRDIAALRAAEPGRAKEWRLAVRAVLAPLLAGGARVAGYDKTGWYVVTR